MSQNKCSLKVVKDGRVLSGTAAILHATSRDGGYDAHMAKFAQKVIEQTMSEHLKEQRRPKLSRVK
ncbi:hypothetical protein P3795_18625 [Pseudomonas aeruginosa]|jgi:hypothetical protein|uniref:Uncharacterized protein n=1 Tax=Pseudomonas frederiksbergensis TaxID=104087 RepID=A0A0B1Z4D4_9PSED|nr:hypothetical protein [Pseudomonas frederiksbergensis]KHK64203.1 hypothetical protein JZ00_13340 [Pseudomonas frederiksbergensis]MDP5476013.1 hypothetical protein [Pseudomonas aeruginosa]MDP5518860.1 hypothetical protein [Pseudomonas aeruginosa]